MSREVQVPAVLVRPTAEYIAEELGKKYRLVQICGSLRRNTVDVGDIDIVVCDGPDDVGLDKILTGLGLRHLPDEQIGPRRPYLTEVPGLRKPIKVDVWQSDAESFGSAILYATGSGPFNVMMRRWTIWKGMRLHLTGVFNGANTRRLAGATEEECFRVIGWDFVPPEERSFPISRKHTEKYSRIMYGERVPEESVG